MKRGNAALFWLLFSTILSAACTGAASRHAESPPESSGEVARAPDPEYHRTTPFHLQPGRSCVFAFPSMRGGDDGDVDTAPSIHNCSRRDPPKYDDTWTPDAAIVEKLEARLVEIEDNVRSGDMPNDWAVSDYYRWYVGLVVKGRRLIYVNAVSTNGAMVRDSGWKTKWMDFCDGGWSAWGVVYDVERDAFFDFDVNGSV